MATYNKEDNIKWNDLATSLQDIIMRKITWNMLHPDLQSWLLDKERRIIELERWRRTKADPMLDDHERRIGSCESQISSLWSKLSDVEDEGDPGGGPSGKGKYYIDEFEFGPGYGFIHFSNNFQMCWLRVILNSSDYYISINGNRVPGTIVPLILPTGRVVTFKGIEDYECIMTTDERGNMDMLDQNSIMYCRPYTSNSIACATTMFDGSSYSHNVQTAFCWGRSL